MDWVLTLVAWLLFGFPLLVVGYFVGRYHERSKLRQRWKVNRILPTVEYMGRRD